MKQTCCVKKYKNRKPDTGEERIIPIVKERQKNDTHEKLIYRLAE